MGTAMRNPGQLVPLLCASIVAEGAALVFSTSADDTVLLPAAVPLTTAGTFAGLAKFATTATGQEVEVVINGVWPGIASAAITRGQPVVVADTSGRLRAFDPTLDSGTLIVGYAQEAAGALGDRFAVLIVPGGAAGEVTMFTAGTGGVTSGAAVVQDTTTNRQVVLPAAADQRTGVIGIALATALVGVLVPVMVAGPAIATASGTITRGDVLTPADATGKVKSDSLTTGVCAMAVGFALDSATNGNPVLVLVGPFQIPNGIVRTFVAGTGGVTVNCAVVADTTTNRQVVLPAGADPVNGVLGIALNTAIATGTVAVLMHGIATVQDSGAGFARGARLAIAGVNGQLKTAAPGAGTNDMILGTALDTVGASGTGLAFINPCLMQG
jgi:hypothetical protein